MRRFDGYLECQVLGQGFAHLVCRDCGEPHLLALCCRGRGFCPCCTGRRMAQTAANLTEFVLPDAPLRQWVLTVPHALRPLLAYDRRLLPAVYRIFYDSLQRFYGRRLGAHDFAGGRTGAVTAIQRASGDLRVNPHLHGVFLDGVFVESSGGELDFAPLPALSDMDVCELLQTIVARVVAQLGRQGLLQDGGQGLQAPDAGGEPEQLVLSALAQASATGSSLAGPELRQGRAAPRLPQADGHARALGRQCVVHAGFSLHARTTVAQGDKAGRERLSKYILRPPLAAERLERLGVGRVRLRLKRPFSDGTWAVEMDELSLVARLAALVPPPWQNQLRYSGVLASASQWRSRVVPQPPPPPPEASTPGEQSGPACEHDVPPLLLPELPEGKGSRYWPWRMLKARTFGDQSTTCPSCDGPLRLRALVQDRASARRILEHLGLPTDIPSPAPARAPPYYRGSVTRLRPPGPQQTLLH